MVDAGNNPYVIAEMTGNSPLTIYKHYYKNTKREEIKRQMEEMFWLCMSIYSQIPWQFPCNPPEYGGFSVLVNNHTLQWVLNLTDYQKDSYYIDKIAFIFE